MLYQLVYIGGTDTRTLSSSVMRCADAQAAIETFKAFPKTLMGQNGTAIVELHDGPPTVGSLCGGVKRVIAEAVIDSESNSLEIVRYDGDEVEVEIYSLSEDGDSIIERVEPDVCENACSSGCETALACGEVGVLREYTPPPQVTVHIENFAIQFAKQ